MAVGRHKRVPIYQAFQLSNDKMREKLVICFIVVGFVFIMQQVLTKTQISVSSSAKDKTSSITLQSSNEETRPILHATYGEDEKMAAVEMPLLKTGPDPSLLPPRADQDLRSPDQPWPKPLSLAETSFWLDLLGNYTEAAPPRKLRMASDGAVPEPVNIKQWVGQGKCKHASMYLGLILDRLRPWSQGGITQRMIDEAVCIGKKRSDFASLSYQILDGEVYARAEGDTLNIDEYARLILDVLQVLKLPDMELGVFSGRDLPVMLRHEVHPIFAYASAEAFSEMLLPCPWYVLPAAEEVDARSPSWRPDGLEDFRKRPGKVFWRGSPNDFVPYEPATLRFAPRMKLVEASHQCPDLLDAHVSSSLSLLALLPAEEECQLYSRWNVSTPAGILAAEGCSKETVDEYRRQHESDRRTSGEAQQESRYALNIDGTGFSERYASQLLNNQLVFKVDTPFFNFYSRFFLPYEHYVPVRYDLSDLKDKILWANENIEEAHRIMSQGARRAHAIFHPNEVMCYTGLALAAFGRLLAYDIPKKPREDYDQYM